MKFLFFVEHFVLLQNLHEHLLGIKFGISVMYQLIRMKTLTNWATVEWNGNKIFISCNSKDNNKLFII